MPLIGVIALILRYFTEVDKFWRPITSQWLKILSAEYPFRFWPKLTHAQSHGLSATAELLVSAAVGLIAGSCIAALNNRLIILVGLMQKFSEQSLSRESVR